ncbi:MAG: tetratricopeptide repeat protein, partial [Methylacidiphilales bacterium]|nr:tetratricopeptide repeat protein [Candidatus Methylacidiphilales bacterium]
MIKHIVFYLICLLLLQSQGFADFKDIQSEASSTGIKNIYHESNKDIITELNKFKFNFELNSNSLQISNKVLKIIMLDAERGLAEAQLLLSLYYLSDEGVTQNNKQQAFTWVKLAADQDLAGAQSLLGNLYYEGMGVTQDYGQAIKWFKLAAEQGLVIAQLQLAYLYMNGKGVDQDYGRAFKWLNIATTQGLPEHQKYFRELNTIKTKGQINYNAILSDWYKYIEVKVIASVHISIGSLYYHGKGVTQDYSEAFKWFKLAAEQGDAKAQLSLGHLYFKG